MRAVGIDALSFYVPNLYLPIEQLAQARDIPYIKLLKGLGLEKMAIPDTNEDAASFAANALLNLIEDYQIDPRTIGRIYLGTESAVDGSKPTATYALEVVEKQLEPTYGARCFKNCDSVDLTFACIGAVDAMQNCLDWVQAGYDRKAIVIASDLSKYELYSTGEYTQGAGAVAVLLSNDPKLVQIENTWGVGMQSVGDFFKPRRLYNKQDILKDAAQDNTASLNPTGEFWESNDQTVSVYKEAPVFDGQYSNACYSDRITEALEHYTAQTQSDLLLDSDFLVFHLPYAYHGRRIIFRNWLASIANTPLMAQLEKEVGTQEDNKEWMRAASKSSTYLDFVNAKIEVTERGSTQIGNMYTASIFMALTSILWHASTNDISIDNNALGLLAYGSGSKAKVAKAKVVSNWKSHLKGASLQSVLDARTAISLEEYQSLHTGQLTEPLEPNNGKVVLQHIESENTNSLGYRTYALNQ